MQGDSSSFEIAESEYDNQIALSPTNVKGEGIKFKKNIFLIKSNILVSNYSMQYQIMNNASV